jgi:hypothetical protein
MLSVEGIVNAIEDKMFYLILEHLPMPDCPQKKDHRKWKKEQVYKLLIENLNKKLQDEC